MKELEEYILKLIKQNYESNVGKKNDVLYILCSALSIIKLAKGTNFGEYDWQWQFSARCVVDIYYDQAIENKGEIKFIKLEDRK